MDNVPSEILIKLKQLFASLKLRKENIVSPIGFLLLILV